MGTLYKLYRHAHKRKNKDKNSSTDIKRLSIVDKGHEISMEKSRKPQKDKYSKDNNSMSYNKKKIRDIPPSFDHRSSLARDHDSNQMRWGHPGSDRPHSKYDDRYSSRNSYEGNSRKGGYPSGSGSRPPAHHRPSVSGGPPPPHHQSTHRGDHRHRGGGNYHGERHMQYGAGPGGGNHG